MFSDSTRKSGDLAGVYEYDGDIGYFYLYRTIPGSNKILGAIKVVAGSAGFSEQDIAVIWDGREDAVGLFIQGQLWAVFEIGTGKKFGGGYKKGGFPSIPVAISQRFRTH